MHRYLTKTTAEDDTGRPGGDRFIKLNKYVWYNESGTLDKNTHVEYVLVQLN